MSINGMPEHRLEEIELRLMGADHRPWRMTDKNHTDHEGRFYIIKSSRRAMKRAIQAGTRQAQLDGESPICETREEAVERADEIMCDGKAMMGALALFFASSNATNEMMDFVSHAPEDVEDLLREVKTLRVMFREQKEKYDLAVKELQSHKVAASRAETKIVDMRRAWRALVKEMGEKP